MVRLPHVPRPGEVAMKRVALVLVVVLALATGSVTGCGDDMAEANAAIEASNSAVDAANELDEEAAALFDEIGELEPGAANTRKALEAIARAEELIGKKNAAVDRAISQLGRIEAMDVPDALKEYARQQTAIADLQRQSGELLLAATAEFKTVYESMDNQNPDAKALEGSFESIESIFSDADDLSAEIERLASESQTFFVENELGE